MDNKTNNKPVVSKKHCIRCGNDWDSTLPYEPKQCPSCHSPLWNKERVRQIRLQS